MAGVGACCAGAPVTRLEHLLMAFYECWPSPPMQAVKLEIGKVRRARKEPRMGAKNFN
jgi:hypothetical protein